MNKIKGFNKFKAYYVMMEYKIFPGGKIMTEILHAGENVRHNKKKDWGIGKIITVEKGGTIRVIFEGNKNVSIAKGSQYLTRIS
ncbi:MAG: DUF3553 domain-containing protein [Desulfobulbaceae bacterium]|nr:DUF3553 domain-containing protein [Desulfobulbaceae bacterium]